MVYFYSAIFAYFLYLLYVSQPGLNKNQIELFLRNLHYYVDKFMRQSDLNDSDADYKFEKETQTTSTNPAPLPEKIKRYEDKYLEEFQSANSSELSQDFLDNLRNNIVMENTPLGNVVMFYDNKKETFVFYSDLTIPYRYLEVVGRKYVITYQCKNIFVDMNEELSTTTFEKGGSKLDENDDKKIGDSKDGDEFGSTFSKGGKDGKDGGEFGSTFSKGGKDGDEFGSTFSKGGKGGRGVFAKFKSYNNNVTKDTASAPSKNMSKFRKENENAIFKEKANRYTYEGKIANFNFLKVVDKKKVDKRFATSWADYKKSTMLTNN